MKHVEKEVYNVDISSRGISKCRSGEGIEFKFFTWNKCSHGSSKSFFSSLTSLLSFTFWLTSQWISKFLTEIIGCVLILTQALSIFSFWKITYCLIIFQVWAIIFVFTLDILQILYEIYLFGNPDSISRKNTRPMISVGRFWNSL